MSAGELILYRSQDGSARIQLRAVDGTVWLTQAEIAELFGITPQTVTRHIQAVYADGELDRKATCTEYVQVRSENQRQVRRRLNSYSLDMILAVGYRTRSERGVQFRQWATTHLRAYLVKGFALDDERLKQAGGGDYFDELLARIRDIRSSEKVFWRKVLDIYATSVDYDPSAEASQRFFATVQNKMHWAAHGHTAAEIVYARADAAQPNMGLTSWTGAERGKPPVRADAGIAKNYLRQDELEPLNRIVTAYLEFAEVQAMRRRPMAMADWITKLDDFLTLSDRDVLDHAGRVSQEQAKVKAEVEYEKFHHARINAESEVERAFAAASKRIEQTVKPAKKPSAPKGAS
jgi:hypothetical protein